MQMHPELSLHLSALAEPVTVRIDRRAAGRDCDAQPISDPPLQCPVLPLGQLPGRSQWMHVGREQRLVDVHVAEPRNERLIE